MEVKGFRTILLLAEEKSMTKAAKKLGITQSAISFQIKSLEEQFGVKLLSRHVNGIEFTPAGQLLLEYAKIFVEMKSRLYAKMNQLKKMEQDLAAEKMRLIKELEPLQPA